LPDEFAIGPFSRRDRVSKLHPALECIVDIWLAPEEIHEGPKEYNNGEKHAGSDTITHSPLLNLYEHKIQGTAKVLEEFAFPAAQSKVEIAMEAACRDVRLFGHPNEVVLLENVTEWCV
jgi:hypothetical protein